MRGSIVVTLGAATCGTGHDVVCGERVGLRAGSTTNPAHVLFGQDLGADAAVLCSEATLVGRGAVVVLAHPGDALTTGRADPLHHFAVFLLV